MRSKIWIQVAAGLLISLLAWPQTAARAQACTTASARRIKKLNIDAMDENDRWELAKARQKLEDAKLIAQSRKCMDSLELATTYILLGVIELRSRKRAAMEAAWKKALEISAGVQIPARVRSSKVLRLFTVVKAQHTIAPRPAARHGGTAPKAPPKGFEHVPVVKWEEGKTLTIQVRAADNMAVQRVSLFYKTDVSPAVKRLEMIRKGDDQWSWSVVMEGGRVRGKQLSYYLVAYTAGDAEVAASGNSANMHITMLTSAAMAARRAAGEENPLTGGTLVSRRRAIRRRVASQIDHALENPDGSPVVRRRTAGTVTKTHAPTTGFKGTDIFFASIGLGTGFGLMQGKTEVTGEDVPGAPSIGSLYGQLEIGYLITQSFSLNFFGRFGGLFISDKTKDPETDGYYRPNCNPTSTDDCKAKAAKNDKEYLLLLRVRYQSGKLLPQSLPVNLMWYIAGGVGYGVLRHLVKARLEDPLVANQFHSVNDTDLSNGFVPNLCVGIQLCVTKQCGVNIFVEANYLAAFTTDPDNNTYFHLDFTLGGNFRF
ncbi:MAG: hypothetical protein ABI333_08120 [bacterium]